MRYRCLAKCVFPVAAGLEILTPDSCFYYCSRESSKYSCCDSIKVTEPNRFQLLTLLCGDVTLIQLRNGSVKCVLSLKTSVKRKEIIDFGDTIRHLVSLVHTQVTFIRK